MSVATHDDLDLPADYDDDGLPCPGYEPPEWGAEFWAFMQDRCPQTLPSLRRQFEDNPEAMRRAVRLAELIRDSARK